MAKFNELDIKQKQQLLNEASSRIGLDSRSIEKDWWVTTVLRALFRLPYANSLSFKGGTNLSKCWGLIQRFSEDIDIGIDREYLGFSEPLSKTQISDRLRRAACSFVREKMCRDLKNEIIQQGLNENQFKVSVNITSVTTTDPEIIIVDFISSLNSNLGSDYIAPKVKIEISGRSMSEPVKDIPINSLISEAFIGTQIEEQSFNVRAVLPERTFLEKVFLLHEEFSKGDAVRVDRMSRHMYDIYKMIPAISEKAINDESLYHSVIEHRRKFIGLKGFDYNTLYSDGLSIVPCDSIATKWSADYDKMKMYMIYGMAPAFEEVLDALRQLNIKIKNMHYMPLK